MKKLVLAIGLVIASSITIFSQTKIDVNKIDFSILEQKVIDQINTYRQKRGLKKLNVSTQLREKWSCVTVNANVKLDSLFHTRHDKKNIDLPYAAEIGSCHVGLKNITYFYKTYEELSISIVNGWLNSPKHKEIIETTPDLPDMYISCCAKQAKSGNLYAFVNFGLIIK